jgi:hypothetical protein
MFLEIELTLRTWLASTKKHPLESAGLTGLRIAREFRRDRRQKSLEKGIKDVKATRDTSHTAIRRS